MEFLPLPVTMMMCSMPEATHSSATYWICGLSTTASISLGCAFVAGRKRVPRPAAGNTALRIRFFMLLLSLPQLLRFLLHALGQLLLVRGELPGDAIVGESKHLRRQNAGIGGAGLADSNGCHRDARRHL